jgi:non-canonical purine NTP pyrophosphatase (RdgB/HAM1 family)
VTSARGGEGSEAPVGAGDWVLVTGNPDKRREAERILGRAVPTVALDLPELQSDRLSEVLRAKAEEAWRRLRRPVVVEETGLELDALRGFPGPLVKWMLRAVGAEGIARIALAQGEPGAVARCALELRHGGGSVGGVGGARGVLVLPARGEGGFGWDPVFQPAGETRTYGELPAEVKDAIGHRGKAWRALLEKLGPS